MMLLCCDPAAGEHTKLSISNFRCWDLDKQHDGSTNIELIFVTPHSFDRNAQIETAWLAADDCPTRMCRVMIEMSKFRLSRAASWTVSPGAPGRSAPELQEGSTAD